MTASKIIFDNLSKVIFEITKEKIDAKLLVSERADQGDYYTNIALRLASLRSNSGQALVQGKPLDIAYEIKTKLDKVSDISRVVSRVEVAPPGFVNFFLQEEYLTREIKKINEEGDKFGNSNNLSGHKMIIEFTDPNPFKEFHIGHLYSNLVGESLARLFESQNADVKRLCYQGDVGLHVAKAIYGMMKLSGQTPSASAPLSVRAQFMGRAYALGSQDYEKNEKTKNEINELNKKIYEKDSSIQELYKKGREWSLEYFDSIYKRLGTKFDRNYFESEVEKVGKNLVLEYLKAGVFEESDGAIIFPGGKYDLHNRVFINSLGLPTYEAKDLGLAQTKNKDFSFDLSIVITAQEQEGYFKVVLKALSFINPEIASKTLHIAHGMVKLPTGKMSSRTGEVITGDWLMDEAVARIRREYPEMDDKTSEKVGLAAIKYALLKGSIGRDIEFKFEDSISLNGASGPYLQYAYVRTQSILKKSKKTLKDSKNTLAVNSEELAILRRLIHFPEILTEAQTRLSPNLVTEYLFNLSSEFNFFYQKHKVSGDSFRLELTKAVGQTLKNGLRLLGIDTVDRM